jgi:hypothetical protein
MAGHEMSNRVGFSSREGLERPALTASPLEHLYGAPRLDPRGAVLIIAAGARGLILYRIPQILRRHSNVKRFRNAMTRGWQRPFDSPIPLRGGRHLVTLKDAAAYIMKLPKSKQQSSEWQAAGEAVIMAAFAKLKQASGTQGEACTGAWHRN